VPKRLDPQVPQVLLCELFRDTEIDGMALEDLRVLRAQATV
jgi:hypothetical protein